MGKRAGVRRTRTVRSWLLCGTAVVGAMSLMAAGFLGLNIALIWSDHPLSHWRSREAAVEFERLHADAMSELPPHRAVDVPTTYGVVRAHVFAGPGEGGGHRRLGSSAAPTAAPIVLLPGSMASSTMWAAHIHRLMRERTVVAVDALGQPGRSVQQQPIATAVDQAVWLDQALDHLGIRRAHVVGVSLGGWMAANLVRHRPGRVASLALVEPVYVFGPARPALVAGGILSSFPLLPEAFGRGYADWIAGGASGSEQPSALAMAHARRHFSVVGPPPDPLDASDLAAIDVPVYALVAGRSVAHDVDEVIKGSAAVRQLELDLVPGASHAVHAERGSWLDDRLLDFIEDQGD